MDILCIGVADPVLQAVGTEHRLARLRCWPRAQANTLHRLDCAPDVVLVSTAALPPNPMQVAVTVRCLCPTEQIAVIFLSTACPSRRPAAEQLYTPALLRHFGVSAHMVLHEDGFTLQALSTADGNSPEGVSYDYPLHLFWHAVELVYDSCGHHRPGRGFWISPNHDTFLCSPLTRRLLTAPRERRPLTRSDLLRAMQPSDRTKLSHAVNAALINPFKPIYARVAISARQTPESHRPGLTSIVSCGRRVLFGAISFSLPEVLACGPA